jgi:anti-anti-sigma factor
LGSFLTIVLFDEQRLLLLVTGDEDRLTQSRRRGALSRALVKCRSDLRVDLTDLSFADASLIVDLALIARRLRRAGRRLVLHGAQPQIARLIEIVGLDRMPGVLVDSSVA